MDCPACRNVQLLMSERQGIEIDYCPSCRGVWLDRGELDKIIERSAENTAAQPSSQQTQVQPPQMQHQTGYGYQQPQGHYQQRPYKKKREGFLGELFDFD